MDELSALTQREYRECSVMCFTETWLQEHISDSNATVPGLQTVRVDRDRCLSSKKKGGGIAVLVNNRWCNPGHITVKERFCGPDIELLARELKVRLKEGIEVYRKKLENKLQQNNARDVFSSAAPSPVPCHMGPTPSLSPQLLPSHTSSVIRTGDTHGATPHPSTSTSFFPAERTVPPSTSPTPCLSQAVRLGGSWRNCTRTRLQVRMVSAPES
ncbi:unnamed protein product [Leuciscus chuanchicus]